MLQVVGQLMGHHIGQGAIADAAQPLDHAGADADRRRFGRVGRAVACVGDLDAG